MAAGLAKISCIRIECLEKFYFTLRYFPTCIVRGVLRNSDSVSFSFKAGSSKLCLY